MGQFLKRRGEGVQNTTIISINNSSADLGLTYRTRHSGLSPIIRRPTSMTPTSGNTLSTVQGKRYSPGIIDCVYLGLLDC